ncbi:unnamed protein product [Musa hybrid cultivar]
MDWVAKTPFQWDWETLELFSEKEKEICKSAQEPLLKSQGSMGICNGSVCSSHGEASSALELGNSSSKIFVSSSVDSSPKTEQRNLEFNFNSAEATPHSSNKIIFARVGGSGTSPVPLAAGRPKEPLTRLKLGHTYFEEGGAKNNVKSSSSLPPLASSAVVAKKPRVSQQSSQSPYCQVEGCNIDLTIAKDYHRKHRICESHSKSPKVIVAGQERRFCQQCSRFHHLSEFDQTKRSCRRRLSDHNARRRKPQPATISFNSSRISSSFYDDRHQMNLDFGPTPLGHITTTVSSPWDGPSNFKLVQPNSWTKSNKVAGINGQLQFSKSCQTHNISTLRHVNMGGLLPTKGTTVDVLNEALESSAFASNLDGAPSLGCALSLLSNDPCGSANPGPTSHIKLAKAKNAVAIRPAASPVDLATRFLQDDQSPSQSMMLPFNPQNGNGGQFQEFQLHKAPYQASFFDSTRIH